MRKIILVFCLCVSYSLIHAQQDDLNFVNFSSTNGLSSNNINSIIKDRYGYMWFATEDGLNRFDGINFTVYNHNELDTNSLATNQLQTLYEDPQGNLWVGTNRTLSLYDRQKDCFHNFNIANGTAVRAICSDNAGHLWIGSYAGLILYDPVRHTAKQYTSDSAGPGHLLSNTVISLFLDSKGRLWVGGNTGLYLYQAATDNFKRFSNDPADPASISDNAVKAITEDNNGHLWVGTNEGGLDLLLPDGIHFRRFKYSKTDRQSLASNRIYSVRPDSNGDLWLGTEEGLNIFDPYTAKVRRITGNDRNKYSLKGRAVRSIYIDRMGIYWVGTVQGGVNKYDKNLGFFNLVQYNSFDPYGLSCSKVTSFAEADNGDLYVGTDGGGVNLQHRNTGLFQHLRIAGGGKDNDLAVLALQRIGSELWIATYQHGVYVLNIPAKSVKHYSKGDGPSNLPSDDIFCIKEDRTGHVWLGTNGKGVCMYDPATHIFHRFPPVNRDGKSGKLLSAGFIRAIDQDSAGNIVIGTVGNGVALFDPVHHTCRVFNRATTGLPLDEAISLYVDKSGIIWAGTPSGGICRLDRINDRFANYSERNGLANAVIYKILEDANGKLWVSTNKGISCFDPARSAFKNYTAENGLQPSSFILGAGFKTKSGELYFGGIEGFNHFSPAAINDNKNVPAIVFTDLRIAGRSVIPGQDAAIKENISMAGEIRVGYKQNFSVDFAALDYTTPHENRYMYRLEGLDVSWNQLGQSRTASFTNLYPGTYKLEVRAKNCNGAWVTPPAMLKIIVKPPFYLTGYAYAFYALLLGLILWGIRYRGIRKLKNKFALEQERHRMKQMIEQERLEAERLHEFDQLKIKFLTNLSHEFRTPVSLILGPLENLGETEADLDKQRQLTMVKRNARRLLNLVNQLLDFRKLEEHELKLNCTKGDIVAFVKDTAESFRDIAERKHIRFTFKSQLGHFPTLFDRDKIERIVFNLLGNAFKFTGKDGEVLLEIRHAETSGDVVILVSDTGVGLSTEEQSRIFDRFFQGNTNIGVMNQGSGIGLSITKEFVRLHGGTISVESEPGKGSVFIVCLPLEPLQAPVLTITDPHCDRETMPVSIQSTPTVTSPLDQLTVLLVEDNDDFRTYLRDNLRSCYKIIEAVDGKDGWQKVISRHPDVIVSDISMPNMDGIELSRKIRADKRVSHIPIVLLTALTENTYQLKGLETGASDYLTKPFPFDILNIKIRNLVSLNQRLRETYSRRLNVETPVAAVQSEDEKLMLKITRYIEANLDTAQLSVEELSKHVYMSHASLYRKIVELTGETPVEFIRSVKLNKAIDLLERSDMKISEIGYAVGFTTPNYFTRAFKAKFNLSPSEYVSLKRKQVG
ncbi:MAG TPA: two-component regulator propeller domain-containing protein [Puia sp.]|uniref:hybrid sensor histidine kinase/response regulator transcription factor n=1 Tax=Puia sp. TaxID=2045100 RepID=UPI002BD8CB0B|nr:two-component regulator propeller domain-containing protein [Puia sp.]HVU94276.1 two-component regulator propeller domain-containing protein [Puia sp.]